MVYAIISEFGDIAGVIDGVVGWDAVAGGRRSSARNQMWREECVPKGPTNDAV